MNPSTSLRLLSILSLSVAAFAADPNTGWKSLFDGKTMQHWQDPSKKDPPGDAWTIENGCLKATKSPRITEDLVSNETYTNFELMWDWKVALGANSGVKYRIQAFPIVIHRANAKFEPQVDEAIAQNHFDRKFIKPGDKAQIYVVGFEYQLIDNERHRDAQRGPRYQTGALYDVIPPSVAASKPVGEWNTSRLVVRGDHIEHWLNGTKVVDGSLKDPAVAANSAERWGAASPVYHLLTETPKINCPISLQNHGDEAWFRNIKIRRLP